MWHHWLTFANEYRRERVAGEEYEYTVKENGFALAKEYIVKLRQGCSDKKLSQFGLKRFIKPLETSYKDLVNKFKDLAKEYTELANKHQDLGTQYQELGAKNKEYGELNCVLLKQSIDYKKRTDHLDKTGVDKCVPFQTYMKFGDSIIQILF